VLWRIRERDEVHRIPRDSEIGLIEEDQEQQNSNMMEKQDQKRQSRLEDSPMEILDEEEKSNGVFSALNGSPEEEGEDLL